MAGALFDVTQTDKRRKMAEQHPNGLVIHISSLNDRSTEVVMQDRISIGASEDCDVKIRMAEGAGTNGPVLELARMNGVYRITSLDSNVEVKLNSRPVKSNKAINDGDEIWIGPSGPSIHFFPIAASAALVRMRTTRARADDVVDALIQLTHVHAHMGDHLSAINAGRAAVRRDYHDVLVPAFCLQAASSFFDGF